MSSARQGWSQRLGILPDAVSRLRSPIWVHAASVGEVLAAEPLVRRLKQLSPAQPILVTTTSLSGRQAAHDRLAADAVMLLPLDLPVIVGSVLRRLRPLGVILVETELWPGLLRSAARAAVPCALVSGRLSPRSARRYQRARWLFRPLLQGIEVFAMQSAADAERIIALGAPVGRVSVVGNLKFARTAALPDQRPAPARIIPAGRIVLIAASTHPGEEALALSACAALLERFPALLLTIAPRRPERFDEVETLLASAAVRYVRRSRLLAAVDDATQVLLLDTLGELPDLLPLARAVYVGGTFGNASAHNVLEPALYGKPVAFGPNTVNIAEPAAALLAANAARRIDNAAALQREWNLLIDDPAAAAAMGARGRALIDAQAAVVDRTIAALAPLLSRTPSLS